MRRRQLCVGAVALLGVACGRDPDTSVSPEDLPQAPKRPAVPPDAFAIEGHGARIALRRPVHLIPPSTSDEPVQIISEADGRRTLRAFTGEPEPDQVGLVKVVGGVYLVSADEALRLDRLGEAEPSPHDGPWRVVVADAVCDWPRGLEIDAFGGELPRIELRRFAQLRDVMVVVRGPALPEDIPSIDGLVAPGQDIEAAHPEASPPWIELRYDYDDDTWRQRHYRVQVGPRVLLVTAQATEGAAEEIFADAEIVAGSLRASAGA